MPRTNADFQGCRPAVRIGPIGKVLPRRSQGRRCHARFLSAAVPLSVCRVGASPNDVTPRGKEVKS